MAKALELSLTDQSPFIFVSGESVRCIQEKLAAAGLKKEEAFAIIHPGARRWYKSWLPEHFAMIADAIIKNYG